MMGVADPASEARWMMEEASGMDATEQIVEANGFATRMATATIDALLARRATGEPIQARRSQNRQ